MPFVGVSRHARLARRLLSRLQRLHPDLAMTRLAALCVGSFPALLAAFPLFGRLLATPAADDCIAQRIPGLGECRSIYCKPERRIAR